MRIELRHHHPRRHRRDRIGHVPLRRRISGGRIAALGDNLGRRTTSSTRAKNSCFPAASTAMFISGATSGPGIVMADDFSSGHPFGGVWRQHHGAAVAMQQKGESLREW